MAPESVTLPRAATREKSPDPHLVRWDSSLKHFTVKIKLGDSEVMTMSKVSLPVVRPADSPDKTTEVDKLVAEATKKTKAVFTGANAGLIYMESTYIKPIFCEE